MFTPSSSLNKFSCLTPKDFENISESTENKGDFKIYIPNKLPRFKMATNTAQHLPRVNTQLIDKTTTNFNVTINVNSHNTIPQPTNNRQYSTRRDDTSHVSYSSRFSATSPAPFQELAVKFSTNEPFLSQVAHHHSQNFPYQDSTPTQLPLLNVRLPSVQELMNFSPKSPSFSSASSDQNNLHPLLPPIRLQAIPQQEKTTSPLSIRNILNPDVSGISEEYFKQMKQMMQESEFLTKHFGNVAIIAINNLPLSQNLSPAILNDQSQSNINFLNSLKGEIEAQYKSNQSSSLLVNQLKTLHGGAEVIKIQTLDVLFLLGLYMTPSNLIDNNNYTLPSIHPLLANRIPTKTFERACFFQLPLSTIKALLTYGCEFDDTMYTVLPNYHHGRRDLLEFLVRNQTNALANSDILNSIISYKAWDILDRALDLGARPIISGDHHQLTFTRFVNLEQDERNFFLNTCIRYLRKTGQSPMNTQIWNHFIDAAFQQKF